MPFNGSGVFNALPAPDFPAIAGDIIYASRFNNVVNDILSGLTTCIAKDGQTPASANLPMNGFKHTGAGSATAAGQYLVYGQSNGYLQQSAFGPASFTPSTPLHVKSTGVLATLETTVARGGVGSLQLAFNDPTGQKGIIGYPTDDVLRISNYINDLVFSTNFLERMRIDTSGNVGIGNTAPGIQGLAVGNSSRSGENYIRSIANNTDILIGQAGVTLFGFTTGNAGFVYQAAAKPLVVGTSGAADLIFGANNSERARIDFTNGNLGLGTGGAGAKKLVVSGGSSSITTIGGRESSVLIATNGIGATGAGGELLFGHQDGLAVNLGAALTLWVLGTGSPGLYGDLLFSTKPGTGGSLVERMRIGGNGRVGIGVANAQQLLDVNGTKITETTSISGNVTVSTNVPIGTNNGGGILLIRGADGSGVAFTRSYLLALRTSGGAAPDVASVQVATVGSATPTFTFGSSGGVLTITSASNNIAFASFIGG